MHKFDANLGNTNSAITVGSIELFNNRDVSLTVREVDTDNIDLNGNSFNEIDNITILNNSKIYLNNSVTLRGGIHSQNNDGHIIISSGDITINGQIGSESSHIGSMIIGSEKSVARVNLTSATKYYVDNVKIHHGSSLHLTEESELIGEIHNINTYWVNINDAASEWF